MLPFLFAMRKRLEDWTLRKRPLTTQHVGIAIDVIGLVTARPCKRCFDLGRGASCRDPAPNERIPRKRKRSNSKHKDNPIEKQPLYFDIVSDIFTHSNPPPFENGCTSQSFPPCTTSASRPCSVSRNQSNAQSLPLGSQPKKGKSSTKE